MFQMYAPNTAMHLILHSFFFSRFCLFFILACVQILFWEGFLETPTPWGVHVDSAA